MTPDALQILSRFMAYERFRTMNADGGTPWSLNRKAFLWDQLSLELGDTLLIMHMLAVLETPYSSLEDELLRLIRDESSLS